MNPAISIEPYTANHKADVIKLLTEADLPTSDLNSEKLGL
jgi:hypothetical protein